jgi:hypothetical protein
VQGHQLAAWCVPPEMFRGMVRKNPRQVNRETADGFRAVGWSSEVDTHGLAQ